MYTEEISRDDEGQADSLPGARASARTPRASGRVAWMTDGYGFVEGARGEQFYFDRSSVDDPRYEDLCVGTPVEFRVRRVGATRQATRIVASKGPTKS